MNPILFKQNKNSNKKTNTKTITKTVQKKNKRLIIRKTTKWRVG